MENIHLALHTIIYLMIFLIPGIIFRRFLFINSFTHELRKGTLFEKSL